jgi:ubiquinone/menaquinone biosynthesis C-methylase UbiE
MAILTLHHWPDKEAGLSEMRRVTRGRIVLLTFDPSHRPWLTDYLPDLAAKRKIAGRGLNRPRRRRTALFDHLARGLDSNHGSIGRLVGTRTCADIQHRLRRPKCGRDAESHDV